MGLDFYVRWENGEWKNNAEFECRDHQLKICRDWAFDHLECIKIDINHNKKWKIRNESGNQNTQSYFFSANFLSLVKYYKLRIVLPYKNI